MVEGVEAGVGQGCPACGQTSGPDARFCENCGEPLAQEQAGASFAPEGSLPGSGEQAGASSGSADLTKPGEVLPDQSEDESDLDLPTTEVGRQDSGKERCAACGGVIAGDGYCEQCGEPAPNERDHWSEAPSSWVAGVCDKGRRHARNEDAMVVYADPVQESFAAIVVCDGVTSAPGSDVASLAAAKEAGRVLAAGGPNGDGPIGGDPVHRLGAWSALLAQSARNANEAIHETVGETPDTQNPPSCTFVAAVVDGPLIMVAWVGDSRAYWIPDDGEPEQLSIDDSWAQEMIADGIPRAQAETSPQAHAITRWLGADAPEVTARTVPTFPESPGWLLVCSDGLWNYASAASDMAALIHSLTPQPPTGQETSDPLALANDLVDWANAQGGRDNITAVVARHRATHPIPVVSDTVVPGQPTTY